MSEYRGIVVCSDGTITSVKCLIVVSVKQKCHPLGHRLGRMLLHACEVFTAVNLASIKAASENFTQNRRAQPWASLIKTRPAALTTY